MNLKSQTPEEIILKKKITLPEVSISLGNYTNLVRSGNLIYLSGKGPLRSDGKYINGKIGKDLNIDQGYEAARLCGLAQISALKKELGDLSKIKRIIKVTAFVNSTDSFTDQPKVVNGYSDLMTEIFGNKGIHARSAVGVSSLPSGWPVEVEMIVEIEP
ncbi:hypothetical protein A1704_06160 [Chryseobacterium cucumeris]|nr:hypothetical protein A1704_06160 [Chryseobacterium cucumeris]